MTDEPEPEPVPAPGRGSRSYGPTVLAGLAGAGLAAVAAGKTWASASGTSAASTVTGTASGSDTAPLAIALALVALASWGVVLVLRGQARRVVAVVGGLAAAGSLVSVLTSGGTARTDAVRAATDHGATSGLSSGSLSAWFFACALGALVTLAALVVAVARAPRWPAMGSRYDAPSARAAAPAEPASEQEMWRAMDAGRDPTE